jgi:hypothetical protein
VESVLAFDVPAWDVRPLASFLHDLGAFVGHVGDELETLLVLGGFIVSSGLARMESQSIHGGEG